MGQRLGDVPIVGDGRDKPLNCPSVSSGNSSEEVMLLTPHPKPSCVSPGGGGGKTSEFFWRFEGVPLWNGSVPESPLK